MNHATSQFLQIEAVNQVIELRHKVKCWIKSFNLLSLSYLVSKQIYRQKSNNVSAISLHQNHFRFISNTRYLAIDSITAILHCVINSMPLWL
jgi:hypothetical protein